MLLREPELAAAVAAVCMTGLAATVQAARGPPKPDKARIDRLAYVVSAPARLPACCIALPVAALHDASRCQPLSCMFLEETSPTRIPGLVSVPGEVMVR